MPTVMAVKAAVAVQGQRDIAVSAPARQSARPAVDRRCYPTPVEQQNGLATPFGDAAELGQEGSRERIATLPAEIDDSDPGHWRPDPGREHDPFERGPALRPRSGAAVHRNGTFEGSALRSNGPGVVARIGLLLVRGVVLLVDDHEAEVADRGEDRRARADYDPRLATGDAIPLVAPLGLPECGVEDRDRVAEALAEPADGLGREGDLGHEHDGAETSRECRFARLEVHLGLAAARRPDEQEMCTRLLVEPCDDARDRGALLRGELRGDRLAGKGLALGR